MNKRQAKKHLRNLIRLEDAMVAWWASLYDQARSADDFRNLD
jgi:hypothetical protein